MSQTSDQMELREEDVRAHYAAALDLIDGFDHAPRIADEPKLIATVLDYAEALMAKVAGRASTAARLEPFTGATWRVEADDFVVDGFSPARKSKGATLTMSFKKPNEVVGNHIAKYQAMKLSKMLMAYDFDRKLNPFAELGGFIFTFMGDGKPGTGKTTLIHTFGMFSNYPENVDDALRQRAGARFLVDGPQTREDYIDILYLLMGKNHDIPVGAHEVFSAQEIKKAVAASFESHARPHEEGLMRVFDKVQSEVGDLDTIAKMGTYLKGIQEADDRFTGRAIKNITDAVKVRAMDFELPDEWMENPELFLFKDYDTKRDMIAELRQPITPEMVIQEINRYADSEFRYADKSDEVAIENMVRDFGRQDAAKKRYLEGKG